MTAHPLAGHASVDASARRISHYRWLEERLLRILGGWIALSPELPVKLLFGRHVWDCAQHADLWSKRLPELRARAQGAPPSAGRDARNRSRTTAPAATWRRSSSRQRMRMRRVGGS